MALHDPITAEQADEVLAELTEKHVANINGCLRAHWPFTVQLIDEALGEFMQDDQARADLLARTARGENAFQQVLADLIHNEALVRAQQELARLEQQRRDSVDEDRAERGAWQKEGA